MEKPLPTERGALHRLLSPRVLKDQILQAWLRFPITITELCLFALYGILIIWRAISIPSNISSAADISFPMAILLSIAIYQWCEYLGKTRHMMAVQALGVILAGGNFAAIATRLIAITNASAIGYSAVFTSLWVAVFFLPVVRKPGIKQQWQYSIGVLGAIASGLFISLITGVAILIIWQTLNILFSIDSFKLLTTLQIIFPGLVSAVFVLYHMPNTVDTQEPEVKSPGLAIAALCKNIILPLALIYTVILYVYGLKIVIEWELPNGMVSWMVTGLISVVLIILYGLQGYLCTASSKPSAKRIASFAMRWLPVIMLPLLVLMSVAIFYRIRQYGITASRLYVATFNIWSYGVVAYLYLSKLPRLNFVATSFAVIFLITSVIPGCNYTSISINQIRHKIMIQLQEAGVEKFPITFNELKHIVSSMPKDQAEEVAENLAFIDDRNNHSFVADIVTHDKMIYKWDLVEPYNSEASFEISFDDCGLSPVPEGYSSIKFYSKYNYNNIDNTISLNSDTVIKIPLDSLCQLDDSEPFKPVWIPIDRQDNSIYVLTGFSARGDNDSSKADCWYLEVEGYILTK